METGQVKTVKPDRGFGFIKRDNGQGDLFFHVKNCDPRITFDDTLVHARVRFETEQGEKGLKAVNVRPAD